MKLNFDVSITTDNQTGRIISAYLQVRDGKVAKTVELVEGSAMADYDRRGNLLGVELIAPCKITVLDKIVREEPKNRRQMIRDFFKRSSPREMVAV